MDGGGPRGCRRLLRRRMIRSQAARITPSQRATESAGADLEGLERLNRRRPHDPPRAAAHGIHGSPPSRSFRFDSQERRGPCTPAIPPEVRQIALALEGEIVHLLIVAEIPSWRAATERNTGSACCQPIVSSTRNAPADIGLPCGRCCGSRGRRNRQSKLAMRWRPLRPGQDAHRPGPARGSSHWSSASVNSPRAAASGAGQFARERSHPVVAGEAVFFPATALKSSSIQNKGNNPPRAPP